MKPLKKALSAMLFITLLIALLIFEQNLESWV